MDELLARALETARLEGARYADVRLVRTQEQCLAVKNGAVDGLTSSESLGLGVRYIFCSDGTFPLPAKSLLWTHPFLPPV